MGVHRALVTRAPYFARLLAAGMRETTTGEIALPPDERDDDGDAAMLGVLRYLYCDQLLVAPVEMSFSAFDIACV